MTTREEFAKLYPGIEPPSWIDEVELLTEQEALALCKLGIDVHWDRIRGRIRWESTPHTNHSMYAPWEVSLDTFDCSICYIIK